MPGFLIIPVRGVGVMVCNWGVRAGANVGAGVGVGDGEESDCGVPWDCARKDPVEAKAVIDNKNATSQVGTATTCGTSFGFSPRRGVR